MPSHTLPQLNICDSIYSIMVDFTLSEIDTKYS